MNDLHNKDAAIEFYEDRYEKGYMEEWDDLKKNKVKEVLKELNLPSKGKALDFGCGNGVFTRLIKDIFPDWEVYGVEISSIAVKNARKRIPDCLFFEAKEAAAYFGQFDFLFSHHVIEHVQDINETFDIINAYLKKTSSQLHVLPCGNVGSYEYELSILKRNGIEKEKDNRFFFEEPGHLRRLTTKEFAEYESNFGFKLENAWYSNQTDGAINWITKSSPRFVKKLTDSTDALDINAKEKLEKLRKYLLSLTYSQFAYTKYLEIKNKWNKTIVDRIKLAILFFPAMIAKSNYQIWDKKAAEEWNRQKKNEKGSEMFLYFKR
jgi:SAM-dependent methyltransferase